MRQIVECTVNGRPQQWDVDVRASLLEVLRSEGLSSVKQACGVGECGCCTVLVDKAVTDSCLYLAVWAAGKNIRTVEGEMRDGLLSPVQQAYVDAGAVQCGFCTPGMIMASTAFVEDWQVKVAAGQESAPVSRDAIRRAHAGNLCRCTGYSTIVDAVSRCVNVEKKS